MREGAARLARVVSVGRNAAWIAFEDERRLRPASLRKQIERLTLVTGDLVLARALDDERAVVDRLEPRAFALERTTAGGRTKLMAANIDAIAVVAAFDRPVLHVAMIDELLAFAEIHGLRAYLLLTKPDLVPAEHRELVISLYAGLGYPTFELNSKNGTGVAEVEQLLAHHHTLLIGQSGVGKSSLFAALGGSGGTVGAVSKTGRGKQTTTSARLQRFENGFLIDSPGVGEFELNGLAWRDVVEGFVEFREHAGACRFRDCTHRSEPGCLVRAAVDAGQIARGRYASYLTILTRGPQEGRQELREH